MLSVVLQWDPVPPEHGVQFYSIAVDDELPLTVPVDQCGATCAYTLTVPEGRHVFRLTATNTFGTSEPATIEQDLRAPAPPTGLRVVVK